jgi:hypothetical protein
VAQVADAAVKKFTAKIVPLRQIREDLGYTQVQIERMEDQDREAAEDAMQRILAGDLASLEAGLKPGFEENAPDAVPVPADSA